MNYNVVYLFHATPVGGAPGTTGAVQWNMPSGTRANGSNFVSDLAYFRDVQNRRAILSIGGANANVDLSTRTRSQAFVASIIKIYQDLGGIDGLDWNNYEGHQLPNTTEMIWISQQLKATYGNSFSITSPPAPWRQADRDFLSAMARAGVLDYAAPQYYDGPGLSDPSYIVSSVNQWVSLLGPTKVAVGFGLSNNTHYSTAAQVESAWRQISATHPTIKGAFNWEIASDENQGWPFANRIAPLITAGSTTTPPTSQVPNSPPVIVGQITTNSVALNWSPPTQPNGTITGYRFGWTSSNGLPAPTWQYDFPAPANPFVNTNLAPNTTYTFTIQAINATGVGAATTITAKTASMTPSNGNGDVNGDGRVNAIDLSIVLSRDGQNFPAADFNGDGTVGAADMSIVLSKWTW